MHTQAYMLRLGTFGFRDMKELISALNRCASAPVKALLAERIGSHALRQGILGLPTQSFIEWLGLACPLLCRSGLGALELFSVGLKVCHTCHFYIHECTTRCMHDDKRPLTSCLN